MIVQRLLMVPIAATAVTLTIVVWLKKRVIRAKLIIGTATKQFWQDAIYGIRFTQQDCTVSRYFIDRKRGWSIVLLSQILFGGKTTSCIYSACSKVSSFHNSYEISFPSNFVPVIKVSVIDSRRPRNLSSSALRTEASIIVSILMPMSLEVWFF